jgi:hypothetical protein
LRIFLASSSRKSMLVRASRSRVARQKDLDDGDLDVAGRPGIEGRHASAQSSCAWYSESVSKSHVLASAPHGIVAEQFP